VVGSRRAVGAQKGGRVAKRSKLVGKKGGPIEVIRSLVLKSKEMNIMTTNSGWGKSCKDKRGQQPRGLKIRMKNQRGGKIRKREGKGPSKLRNKKSIPFVGQKEQL